MHEIRWRKKIRQINILPRGKEKVYTITVSEYPTM